VKTVEDGRGYSYCRSLFDCLETQECTPQGVCVDKQLRR
jgi:hypothetical protein